MHGLVFSWEIALELIIERIRLERRQDVARVELRPAVEGKRAGAARESRYVQHPPLSISRVGDPRQSVGKGRGSSVLS